MARLFVPRLRKQRVLAAGALLALLAEVALRLAEPWPLKIVFDRVLAVKPAGSDLGLPILKDLDAVGLLTISALAVIVTAGLRALAAYGNTVGFALVGNRVLTEVRHDLYRHLTCLSLSFHNKAKSGDLVVRVISDIGVLTDVAVTALLPFLGNVLIMLGMVGVMFWLNRELALLALATVPLFWISTVRFSGRMHQAARRQRERDGAMAATAAESIGAIRIVQALGLEGTFSQVFSRQNTGSLKEGVQATRLAASLERTVDVLIAIGTALVLWYGAVLVLRSHLTPGDLLVFLTYLKNAFKPVRDFAKYTGRLAKASAAAERVVNLFEATPEVRDVPGAIRAPAFRGAVRFEDVGFAYEAGQLVLERIQFETSPGQHVALVGPSGAGKSTLTSLIMRLYDPTAGRVLIDGRDIRKYTLETLRAQISVVLQDPLLFGTTIFENVALGMPGATLREVTDAARLANAHDFIRALPQAYDTALGERGVTLSNGQRQRIAIARAMIRSAPILILDEPTTGLDEENERAVMEAIERLAQGRTTFIITHQLALASSADLILYLENGRILERGTHAQLMRSGGRYAVLFRLQAATRDRGLQVVEERAGVS